MIVPKIGVVVIGRNEGQRLIKCLVSIRLSVQHTVYVDSGSTDGSPEAAARVGAFVVRLNLDLPFTAARARNEGLSALKILEPNIQFVQFLDGDCTLAPTWIDTASTFIAASHDVAVVCGRRRERDPAASIYNRFCDLEWNTPVGEALACGGDALVRVKAFSSVGGFCAALIAGEEPELCLRMRERGWRVWRLDADMTEHDASITRFRQWWRRTVRCGYGYADVSWLRRNSAFGIYRRETLRAFAWGGILPVSISLGAVFQPVALSLALLYPLQICRLAIRDHGPLSWERAVFNTIGKFAEVQGILSFVWRRLLGRVSALIEYK